MVVRGGGDNKKLGGLGKIKEVRKFLGGVEKFFRGGGDFLGGQKIFREVNEGKMGGCAKKKI